MFADVYGAGSVVVGLFPSGGSGAWQLVHAGGATAAIVGGISPLSRRGGPVCRTIPA